MGQVYAGTVPLSSLGADMRRREFIGLIGGAVALRPAAARAQTPIVGILYSGSSEALSGEFPAFRHGLSETGFLEGRNIAFEVRTADSHMDRLPEMANDLVGRRVSVIFSGGNTGATLAAKAATTTIPIVFFLGTDPVGLGIVASLARPGGNITGVTVVATELFGKRLGLLREIVPSASKIGYLRNPTNPAATESLLSNDTETARSLRIELLVLNATSPGDIDRALMTASEQGAGAILIVADPFFLAQRDQLATLAAHHRIPASYSRSEYVTAGGLISYSSDVADAYRRSGVYVGRILKGESPKDLPVQQPTDFKLAVNLKTARALGLTIPPTLLARADEVIE
jgi:putative ABC transport system substrate-binding protein